MAIKVVLAKAHQAQIDDAEIKREVCSIEEEINKVSLSFKKNTINFVFIKGVYLHSERKMVTVCLFVNQMDETIKELHGVLRMKFKDKDAQIAKSTINFDEPFMGALNSGEALLVHVGIPIKGLVKNENFTIEDIEGSFEDVRITMN